MSAATSCAILLALGGAAWFGAWRAAVRWLVAPREFAAALAISAMWWCDGTLRELLVTEDFQLPSVVAAGMVSLREISMPTAARFWIPYGVLGAWLGCEVGCRLRRTQLLAQARHVQRLWTTAAAAASAVAAAWVMWETAVATRLLWGSVYWRSQWTMPQIVGWCFAAGVLFGGQVFLASHFACRTADAGRRSVLGDICYAVTLAGLAVVTLLSGSQIIAWMALLAAWPCTLSAVTPQRWARALPESQRLNAPTVAAPTLCMGYHDALAAVPVTSTMMLLMAGILFAEVKPFDAGCLALACTVTSLLVTPLLARRWEPGVASFILVVALVGAAVASAGYRFASDTREVDDNPYMRLSRRV